MLATNFEVVGVMAGRAKYLTGLRMERRPSSRFRLGLAHLVEDLLGGPDQVYPPLLLSGGTERHAFWVGVHGVTTETHIVEVIPHIEFDK